MAGPRSTRGVSSFVCQLCQRRNAAPTQKRFFASTPSIRADSEAPSPPESSSPPASSTPRGGALGGLASIMDRQPSASRNKPAGSRPNRSSYIPALDARPNAGSLLPGGGFDDGVTLGPHRLHVYSTKHNTHLTLVQAPRLASETAGNLSGTKGGSADANKMIDVLMAMSAGNLGFRKAGRSSFDAAYQLTGYFFTQIRERGMLRDIEQLEVVLRGFGAGRDAVQKVILSPEGRFVRPRISAVLDSTRVKHGGTRGKKPRRLG